MPEVETLMVANHIEAINGLLYVSGGGWTDLWRGTVQRTNRCRSTTSGWESEYASGWGETNKRRHLVVKLAHEDGEEVFRGEADVEVGRPPGVPAGSDQRAVLAITVDCSSLVPAATSSRPNSHERSDPSRSESPRPSAAT